ncbi:hypothetical protein [Streptomyces sp. PRh5]|uniref:hypothetical protein n=1 Tax=Streptomyces sp. PRh5 TaxID=1158056 RepID=UPI0004B34DF6|nr:hypothetical protein [Streptomyces sp. PRh5]
MIRAPHGIQLLTRVAANHPAISKAWGGTGYKKKAIVSMSTSSHEASRPKASS